MFASVSEPPPDQRQQLMGPGSLIKAGLAERRQHTCTTEDCPLRALVIYTCVVRQKKSETDRDFL
ncbi:MAG TPA: hypothetical protein PLC99_25200 [Verrucomicrobiota bacterium]|jgi:hypothetical protein|nr:hypothetical protein [Verrucomicrobiota bacterium]